MAKRYANQPIWVRCFIVFLCVILVDVLYISLTGISGCSSHAPHYGALGHNNGVDPNRIQVDLNDVEEQVILIGDAGSDRSSQGFFQSIKHFFVDKFTGGDEKGSSDIIRFLLGVITPETFVVYLGDNVYDYTRYERILRVQLSIQGAGGKGVLFIPGNHDWEEGEERLTLQTALIEGSGGLFLPQVGCPGPTVHELNRVKIIALDSQWWLFDEDNRPRAPGDCPYPSQKAVLDGLKDELTKQDAKYKIVVAHHPLQSNGLHGGHHPKYLWGCLPVGPVYILSRKLGLFGASQDIGAGAYAHFINGMREAMAPKPPLVYAAGHDHSLQVFNGEALPFELISGSGAKTSYVKHDDHPLFAQSQQGFMILSFLKDGRVALQVFSLDEQADLRDPIYTKWIVEQPTTN